MAQQRQQSTFDKLHNNNDHVSVGIRPSAGAGKQPRTNLHRRFKTRRLSIGSFVIVALTLIFVVSASAFFFLSYKDKDDDTDHHDDFGVDLDFLANVTRTERAKILKFGHGLVGHGRDSRYWDRDDRRRDDDYGEELVSRSENGARDETVANDGVQPKVDDGRKVFEGDKRRSDRRVAGLYNEAGRNELKMYEAEYEASLKGVSASMKESKSVKHLTDDRDLHKHYEEDDLDDEYNDEIDMHDIRLEDYNTGLGRDHHTDVGVSQGVDGGGSSVKDNTDKPIEDAADDLSVDGLDSDKLKAHGRHVNDVQSSKRAISERKIASKKRPKRRKYSGACNMKVLNSTVTLVEPPENQKFAKFSLGYTELEENIDKLESWEPRFAGHQSLEQREQSFVAHDQTLSCGFVKSPKGYPSTGFDLAEEDEAYISSCHIAVISCIFGNSDRLRSPMGKTVSRFSRKNVCFVMFVDDVTLKTLSSEGHMPDRMGYIGIWRIVVVKNLPYTDMRRVGKVPKLLAHRLFQNARYSIWLDSKLRLQLDPLLVLEYFLWRKGREYAISNHYDRHCVWEEVAQNKRLNKYNHTIIDEQFAFYQADGLTKFNPLDPQKLLPSNVPEGSFIVRAHTPMSNLFSCLWFNEVERFTPRDQLSFAYTYQKLRRMNPSKPFYFSMFKDCERRKIAKLFRHRSEETRYSVGQDTE
uniref:probable hexosyltransferase MUCI70 n=1 Tax=Erigeron canadensis TaxID=72917 RepID=UPI001CB9658A|nr:probable hexosyltransferase MUCI70 [Erigeron canadensis]